jgi:hypothetical protein
MVSREPNSMIVVPPERSSQHSGTAGQSYGMGNFRCGPDEVVLLEFTPPPCLYWSVSLATWWWEAIDPASRQSSLNGHQARLDGNGVFRGVIGGEDPGVANWLDTAGHERGTVIARFVDAEAAIEPRFRVVPREELHDAVASDTPTLTPTERRASLVRRREAFVRRYRR